MREKEVKVSVQKMAKILWATLSLIVMIISIWIIADCFKKSPDQEELVISYNSNTTLDYKVYLKSNRFFDRSYVDKNKKYVANLIDYVNVDLNHLFNTSKTTNTYYTYSVTATINSEYELSGVTSELWSKNYQLVAPKTVERSSSSGFTLKENLKIDYSKYDEMAKKFKEEYGISSDTKLTITININSKSNLQGYSSPIIDSKKVTLVMPLNRTVTDISVAGTEPTSKNITNVVEGERNVNYVLLVVSIIMLVLATPVCFISFYKLFKITNVSQYLVMQKKILRGYGDIIAEVTTKPNLTDLHTIEVKEFEDLINIEEELRIPILFYEIPNKNESWFVITHNNQAYRYILK